MKKIDIEKWERKNPPLPQNFFNEMQEKVLNETTRKKEPKRFRLNLAWASAAAVAVFFGLIFFFNFEKNEHQTEILASAVKVENTIDTEEPVSPNKNEEKNIVYHQPKPQKEKPAKMSFASQKLEKATPKETNVSATNLPIEEILNSMTDNELEDLAMNYAQDIYFDLY